MKTFPHNKDLKLFLIIKILKWNVRVAWFNFIWRLSYYYNATATATAVYWIDPNLQPTDQLFCSCFLELAPSNPFLYNSKKIREHLVFKDGNLNIWRLSHYYNATATAAAVYWIDPNLQPTDQLFCSCFLELAPSNPFLSTTTKDLCTFGIQRW